MECPKCGHKIYIKLTPEELIICPYCEQRMVEPQAELPLQKDEDIAPAPNAESGVAPKPEEPPAAPVREETPLHVVEEAPPVSCEPEQPTLASARSEVSKTDIEETPYMRWERENRERLQREITPPVIETASKPPSETPEEIPQTVIEKPVRHEEPPPASEETVPPRHETSTVPPATALKDVPQPVSEEPPVVEVSFCAACGQKLPPGSQFCLRCGQRITLLEGGTEAEQPQAAPPPPECEIPVRRAAPSREDITELATPKVTETATPPPMPSREDISKLVNEEVAEPSVKSSPYLESKPEPKPAHPLLPTMHVVPSTTPEASGEPLWPKITVWMSMTLQPLKDFVSGQWRLRRLYRKWTKDGILAPEEIPSAEALSQIAKESGAQPMQSTRLVLLIVAGLVFVAFFVFIGITMSQCK
ncbi:MAG: hypothetical protein C4542_07680 [Dehalococcoidia bacterium]|nr:MAG: hypothetical protein C4542_07680 [Dehalococcoidia bacterium]